MWRKIVYVAAGALVAVLFFILGGRLMLEALERQLIYFPARVPADLATPRVAAARQVEEVWLDASDGVRVHGIYVAAEQPIADLLFFHGNAGNLYDRLDNVGLLVQLGFNVLIMDYRGYGKSGGQPSEATLHADATLAYRHLTGTRDVDPARLVVFGRSLGSAVAIELATTQPVGALIIESPFTSAADLGRVHYGFLPTVLLRSMTHKFDSIAKVGKLAAPVLVIHGDVDRIVPTEMGRRLHAACPEPKEWYEIRGAGHNDTLIVGGAEYVRRLQEFVRRHLPAVV